MIRKIEYDAEYDDLTIWFDGSDEPFNEQEFDKGSKTRDILDELKVACRFAVDESESSEKN